MIVKVNIKLLVLLYTVYKEYYFLQTGKLLPPSNERRVPGVSSAPRWNTACLACKPPQNSHELPFQAPHNADKISGGLQEGEWGMGTLVNAQDCRGINCSGRKLQRFV